MTRIIKQPLIPNQSQSWKEMGWQLKQQSTWFTTNKLFQRTVDLGFSMFLYEKHTFLLGVVVVGGGGRSVKSTTRCHYSGIFWTRASELCSWPNRLLKRREAKCHKDRRRAACYYSFWEVNRLRSMTAVVSPDHNYGPVKHTRPYGSDPYSHTY